MKLKTFISSDSERRFLIGTHNGSFSIDEVVSCAILAVFYSSSGYTVEIVRTRQFEKLKYMNIIINVSSHNSEQKYYETSWSTWQDFGEKLISVFIRDCNANTKYIADELGKNIFLIDKNSDKNPFSCISNFIPLWNQLNSYEENFKKAFNVACILLEQIILKAISDYEAKKSILYNINSGDMPHQENLFFHSTLEISNEKQPWLDTILGYNLENPNNPVNFVIFPNLSTSDWTAICVPISLEESCSPRIALPKKWLGLNGEQLADITGVSDAIFCSDDGLSMKAKTKDGIRSLCFYAYLGIIQKSR